MLAAGDDEPIPFNRVSDAGRIGLDRAQVAEGLPSLRLAAGRLIEFAHDANGRLLERANLWRPSSALWCCALWHIAQAGRRYIRGRVVVGAALVAASSDDGELATLKKVAFQRLTGHAQHTENRIWSLVHQIKFALAAAFAGRSVVIG